MKVLELITRLDRGGSPEVVLYLAKALRETGFETAIVTGPTAEPPEDLEAYSKRTGVVLHHVRHLQREIRKGKH